MPDAAGVVTPAPWLHECREVGAAIEASVSVHALNPPVWHRQWATPSATSPKPGDKGTALVA